MNASLRSAATILPLLCLIGLFGCGSKPYGVRVADAELLPTVRKIAVWPSSVMPSVRNLAETPAAKSGEPGTDSVLTTDTLRLNEFIDSVLTRAIGFDEEVEFITPDSMQALLRKYVPDYSRLNPLDWRQYRHLAVADAMLTTEVSFRPRDEYTDSDVTLSLYDRESGRLIAASRAHDPRDMWSGGAPSIYVTLDFALKQAWRDLEQTLVQSSGDELKWWIQ